MAEKGRPSKYKPEYCMALIRFMSQPGEPMPFEAFAATIGVDRDTLYEWEKVHKDFSDAKKAGRAMGYHEMMHLGFQGLKGTLLNEQTEETVVVGKQKNKEGKTEDVVKSVVQKKRKVNGFNPTMWIFMMKNMHGWKDRIVLSDDDLVDSMDFNGGEDEAS